MRVWAKHLLALGISLGPSISVQADRTDRPIVKLPKIQSLQQIFRDKALVSVAGRDIDIFSFRDSQADRQIAKHRFLIQGGLHGNEVHTSEFVVWLMKRYMRGESALNDLPSRDVMIDFLPRANPDGLAKQNRYNARGVNLNRNFDVLWGITRENPGSTSFSEPETRAIQRLFEERRYTAAIDIHGYVNWVVAPSSYETLAALGVEAMNVTHRAERYRRWQHAIRQEMRVLEGYELKTAGSLGDGGAFEDWAFWAQGSLALCLELEGIQRFVRPYDSEKTAIAPGAPELSIDLYKRYEKFIARMLAQAIAIDTSAASPSALAAQP